MFVFDVLVFVVAAAAADFVLLVQHYEINEQLFDLMPHRGRQSDSTLLHQEASKMHLYLSSKQRPLEGVEDLESKPIWSLEKDVGLTAHDEDVKEITEKLEKLQSESLSLPPSEWYPVSTGDLLSGNLTEAPLFTFGLRRHHTCSLLPEACSLVSASASSSCLKCASRLTRLSPGTSLRPRCGPTNTRLRLHLPLRAQSDCAGMRVSASKGALPLRQGEWLSVDESYEHEMWNECEEDVVLLSMDVPHPDVDVAALVTNKFNKNGRTIFAQM